VPVRRQPALAAIADHPRLQAQVLTHPDDAIRAVRIDWLRFWAPKRLGWWVAVSFMIGSALFAIGGAQATWPDSRMLRWIDPGEVGWIFFVGSLFFTAAAYLQFVEALNNEVADRAGSDAVSGRRCRFFGWEPHNLGFMASLVQLVGTVLFNFDTADALVAGLGWEGEDLLVWTPDMTGSICFFIASEFAVMEFSHHYWSFRPASVSWWIVVINLFGSIFFQVSAVTSFLEPGSTMVSPWLANLGTFIDAVCFLIGAYLLIPELFERAK
jgi:hypothetical protein